MKRIIFSSIIALISLCSFALPGTEMKPGLYCDLHYNYYEITLDLQDFQVATDTLEGGFGAAYFSYIRPCFEDRFDYMGEDGLPELPFYSLELLLPLDVTDFHISDMQVLDSIIIPLPLDYVPAQIREDFDNGYSYDSYYYQTSGGNYILYNIEESNYRGQKGLTFSIFPCRYIPNEHKLILITNATFEIAFDGTDLSSYINSMSNNTDLSIFNFYDNFNEYPSIIPPIHGDGYLIITADTWENNFSLADFVSHKEDLGYDVTLTSMHDIGSTPLDIRTYIKNLYTTRGIKYVLLVGDVSDIPFSDGQYADVDDPPTDIFYACLSKTNMSDQWRDLNPSVFLGRWPVRTAEQLEIVVQKTKYSDLHLGSYNPKKFGIFSGDERYFYTDGAYFYDNLADPNTNLGYAGDLFDGRNFSASGHSVMMNYLEDTNSDPTWMFIYTGHGSTYSIGDPYRVHYNSIDSIATNMLDFQSFGFAFACLTGNIYDTPNFARSWLTSKKGGVTFMGATTNTYYNPDRYFSRKLFMQLEDNMRVRTIGEFVGNGKAKYYNADRVVYRRREAKKYVLYGDPSLYLLGLDIQYEPTPQNIASRDKDLLNQVNNETINDSSIEHTGTVSSVRIYSPTGQLILTSNTSHMDLRNLPSGVYLAIIDTKKEQLSQKIVIK